MLDKPKASLAPITPRDIPPPEAPSPPKLSTEANLDRMLHASQSRFTAGRSPSTLGLAFSDWAVHAMNAPFQTAALARTALAQCQRLAHTAMGGGKAIAPLPGDRRFAHPAWQQRPYDLLTQAVLLGEEWWDSVVRSPGGVDPHNQRIVAFTVRQWLDLMSPSNVPWLNPEVIEATRNTGGANLAAGMRNLLRDQAAAHGGAVTSSFTVGGNLAATPGKVVFRNALIELIQYAPTTATVGVEPVLIVPAWIMKYYILDLSPGNSLIRWLVAQGRTVFAISWRNPGEEMRDTSLDDYRALGVTAAIDAVQAICGDAKIHATGYCLGGTLLTIAAAAMARDNDDRLASLSLFAAQTDFTEAGELQLFITEDQLDFLNEMMQTQGYLSSAQMGGAFQMLRSNDLIWSHAIRDYLLGEHEVPFDLMAWNADGTRLPARMHIEYLRGLFLHNDLAEGRFHVAGRPLAMDDIRLPMFVVSTERDHIAPWHSVFKLHLLNDGELTFVLTSGGHNAGIVSEPGHPHRHFRIRVRGAGTRTLGPDEWERDTVPQDGSWWLEWSKWLDRHSGPRVDPPPMGAPGLLPLCDAPGTYVREG
ncbi:alpha/beta fold hydrolase [Methylocapsa sp. D3K7]|uniref:PHA/PHB synthase family protein n=1 Tax=Methylocapsa sp. D3K7 TaxID=3041435 RepID=UPI00244EA63B|nr:alpha/beta fold hydrolase [Methylocapsa sp. D3K7]WGJ13245.1 alpha/beta fold hydrolase [Methylocapsa sp. D3K7]